MPAPQSNVSFVKTIQPRTVSQKIRKREAETGIKLDPETIEAERIMMNTLEIKTIPRLRDELEFSEARFVEYSSKKPHWNYALGLYRKEKFAGQVDRDLKKPKINPELQKKANDFVASEDPIEENV